MKRFVKAFIVIITVFGFIKTGLAASCNGIEQVQFTSYTLNRRYYYGGYAHSVYAFPAYVNKTGKTYKAYCRNADLTNPYYYNRIYGGGNNCLALGEIKLGGTSERDLFNAGMYRIISQSNPDDTASYFSTTIAFRLYEMLWKNMDTNFNISTGAVYGMYGDNLSMPYYYCFVRDYLKNNSTIKSYINTIGSSYFKAYSDTEKWCTANYQASYNTTAGLYNFPISVSHDTIKAQVIDGLKYVVDYKASGGAATEVSVQAPKYTFSKTDGTGVLTYEVSGKGLKTGEHININFECTNCSSKGVKIDYYINNISVSNLSQIETRLNASGKATVKVVFRPTRSDVCDDLIYKSTVEYPENGKVYYASAKTDAVQNMVLYVPSPSGKTTEKYDGTVDLCNDCGTIRELCDASGNPNSAACKKFNDLFGGTCGECKTYVSSTQCNASGGDIDILEGYNYDGKSCTRPTTENIKNCVIKGKDSNGNSFEETEVSSKYCKVYCKQDYHINVPGIKSTNSGRYFTLEASMNGTKTCYTTKIDEEQFEIDFTAALKDVVDKHNIWAEKQAAYDARFVDKEIDTDTYTNYSSKGGYSCSKKGPCKDANGNSTTCPSVPCSRCSADSTKGKCSEAVKTKNWTYTYYDYNLTATTRSGSGTYGDAKGVNGKSKDGSYSSPSASCGNGHCSNTSAETAFANDGYSSSDIATAKSNFESAIKKLNNIISDYNECSEWSISFRDNPDLYFDYFSKLSTFNNKFKKSNGGYSTSEKYCNNSIITDDYGRCNGSALSDANTTRAKKIITLSGKTASVTTVNVYNARYVKKSASRTINYITPTQYIAVSPSGSIVVSSRDVANGITLENGAVVPGKTYRGYYSYTLHFEKLGEYFDKTSVYGRVWGDSTSTYLTGLSESASCHTNDALFASNGSVTDGVYRCVYKVDYPDSPPCIPPNCPPATTPYCANVDGTFYCKGGNICTEAEFKKICCPQCIPVVGPPFVNGEKNYSYKQISPSSISKSDRNSGPNWKSGTSSMLEFKAKTTIEEITANGETIYDDTIESNVEKNSIVSVNMTNAVISKIKDYNKNHNEGLLNNSLTCYDYVTGGKTYEKVFCYSELIDELVKDSKTKNDIKVPKSRISPNDVANRKSKSGTTGYWTSWNGKFATIRTTYGLSINDPKYGGGESSIAGPAWK